MRTLATVNHKGGSCKTTTAVNLSAALAETGRSALVIDLDPQFSASRWLGVADAGRGLLDVLVSGNPLEAAVHTSSVSGLEVAAASAWLLVAEQQLAGRPQPDLRLQAALRRAAPRWDYVVIDCPPALGTLTANALAAAEELLVPVEAHFMALEGLAQLEQAVESARKRLNPSLRIGSIVACRVDSRTRHGPEVVATLRERFGDNVRQTVVRENVRLAECPSFQEPITRYDARSTGAADYRALAREVIDQERSDGRAA